MVTGYKIHKNTHYMYSTTDIMEAHSTLESMDSVAKKIIEII